MGLRAMMRRSRRMREERAERLAAYQRIKERELDQEQQRIDNRRLDLELRREKLRLEREKHSGG